MGGGTTPPPLLQVAGGMVYATSYTLDGLNHLNTNSGGTLTMPFPDALQEFKVDTSGASVEQGKAAGISAVTKSGTNALHGDVFEFLRNDAVNARQYFATAPSTLKRNQFGGTLGGALIKDRLFFFAGYQQTTIRENPNNLEAFLPTDESRRPILRSWELSGRSPASLQFDCSGPNSAVFRRQGAPAGFGLEALGNLPPILRRPHRHQRRQ